jgi:hypothetical protein
LTHDHSLGNVQDLLATIHADRLSPDERRRAGDSGRRIAFVPASTSRTSRAPAASRSRGFVRRLRWQIDQIAEWRHLIL